MWELSAKSFLSANPALLSRPQCKSKRPKEFKLTMKAYRNQIIVFVFALLCLLPICSSAQIPKVHRHPGRMESMLKEVGPEFSISEITLEKNVEIENRVTNKTRTLEAFTVSGTRIFIKDLKSRKIFELKGLPFEWRDFSDLVWSDNQTLMFDRWVEPHYGNHYAVNFVKRKLMDVAPFPDAFMLKQKNKQRRGR